MDDLTLRGHIPETPKSSNIKESIKSAINKWHGRLIEVQMIGTEGDKEFCKKTVGEGRAAKNAKDLEKKLKDHTLVPIPLKAIKDSKDAKLLTHKEIVFVKADSLIKNLGLKSDQSKDLMKKLSQDGLKRELLLTQLSNKLKNQLFSNANFNSIKENLTSQWSAPVDQEIEKKCETLMTEHSKIDQLSGTQLESLIIARTGGSNSINSDEKQKECWLKADNFIRGKAEKSEDLSLEDICKINKLVNGKGGKLRDGLVQAGGANGNYYVHNDDVKPLLEGVLLEIKKDLSTGVNPVIIAAKAYQKMVSIHPFSDGNGRTCRLVMDYVLLRCGLPPASLGKNVNVAIFGQQKDNNETPSNAVDLVRKGVEETYKNL